MNDHFVNEVTGTKETEGLEVYEEPHVYDICGTLDKLRTRQPGLMNRESYHEAAVFLPLIKTEKGFDVLFEVRSSKLSAQPGDICFPGGAIEEGESPQEAASRETCEELLVKPEQVEIVCTLDCYLNGRMMVHPFAGYLRDYNGTFYMGEVAETFRVPLSYFLETEPEAYEQEFTAAPSEDFPYDRIQGGKNYKWRKRVDRYLFYNYEGREIWGFTAAIVHAFAQMMTG